VSFNQSSNLLSRKFGCLIRCLGYPHTLPHMRRGADFKSSFVHKGFVAFCLRVHPPTSVGFAAHAAVGLRAAKRPCSPKTSLVADATNGFSRRRAFLAFLTQWRAELRERVPTAEGQYRTQDHCERAYRDKLAALRLGVLALNPFAPIVHPKLKTGKEFPSACIRFHVISARQVRFPSSPSLVRLAL